MCGLLAVYKGIQGLRPAFDTMMYPVDTVRHPQLTLNPTMRLAEMLPFQRLHLRMKLLMACSFLAAQVRRGMLMKQPKMATALSFWLFISSIMFHSELASLGIVSMEAQLME